jgi:chromosomal replication initiation ATPase DnaA
MNLHVPTPTQAALAQARKDREARIKAAARIVQLRESCTVPQETRRAVQVQEAVQQEISARERNEARRRKEMWRASWVKMVELAEYSQAKIMEILRRKAVETAYELERLRLPTVKDIILEVAEKYGVTANDILSDRRSRNLAQPRFEVCWRARNETRLSMPQIGRSIGGRDHTTVLNAIRRYEAMRREIAIGKPAYSIKTRNSFFNPDLIITDGANG